MATEAGTLSTTVDNVRSWGLERINQVNLPLVDVYNPGADGTNVHGEMKGEGGDAFNPGADGSNVHGEPGRKQCAAR